jgi:hypothetical protein
MATKATNPSDVQDGTKAEYPIFAGMSLDWSDPFRLRVNVTRSAPLPRTTTREIVRFVSERFDLKPRDLLGPWRPRTFSAGRHIAMWMIRQSTELSYPQIGRTFNRDHSAVIHGCKRIERAIADGEPLGIQATACLADFQRPRSTSKEGA